MTEKQLKYHRLYMDIAKRLAEMSYSKRLQVGALLVKDDIVISHGWNGMPAGMGNCCEYEPQEGVLLTKDEVLHAEQNTITKAAKHGISTKDSTLYITHSPCIQCAKLIQQSGINKVVYADLYRSSEGIDLLSKFNIEVIYLNESNV